MQLIIYPFIVCVGIFLIQLFFIIRKNKIVYNDIQKKDKKHWKLVIKILVALIISIIVGVLSLMQDAKRFIQITSYRRNKW